MTVFENVAFGLRIPRTEEVEVGGKKALKIKTETNGIVYLNLYFEVSDLSKEELLLLNVLTTLFGELSTAHDSAEELSKKVKLSLGSLNAKIELISGLGDLKNCTPYFVVSAAFMKENTAAATKILKELLNDSVYNEADRIGEILLQTDYFLKQSLLSSGHVYAITKALSAFSKEGSLKELLEGEDFCRWFSDFAAKFSENRAEVLKNLQALDEKVFTKDRLFLSYSDELESAAAAELSEMLPSGTFGEAADIPTEKCGNCAVEIPADVGFSALGSNIYKLGGAFSGHCSVLSSFVTFGYLWNRVRVQGGAYGCGLRMGPSAA